MPDYHGTPGPDNIDQAKLSIADGSVIYGNEGNDTITFGNAIAIGGAGNDSFVGTTKFSSVAYWTSTAAVTVNLAAGTANDGLGGVDSLSGVSLVQGSAWDDVLIGSAANEVFTGGRGSNSISGGAGYDVAGYFYQPSTKATVTYDAATDTFTVSKQFGDGDNGVDTLTGIEEVKFSDGGSDGVSFTRGSFTGNFRQQPAILNLNLEGDVRADYLRTGDFNGDGVTDLMLTEVKGLGTALKPTHIFLGDGHGGFVDGTASVFAAGSFLNKGGVPYVSDLNNDRISDIIVLNFGVDALIIDSGFNAIALSNPATGKLVDTTLASPLPSARNHRGVVADFTGDGYADTVIATLDLGVKYAVNDGKGGFVDKTAGFLPPGVLSATKGSYDAAGAFDVNGDGKTDMILAHADDLGASPSFVLLNPGNGDFSTAIPVPLPASGVPGEQVTGADAIDLNGDGLMDMVMVATSGPVSTPIYYTTSYIQFLINEGGGKFRDVTSSALPQTQLNDGGWWKHLTVVDLDHDGYQDLVGYRNASGAMIRSTLQSTTIFMNNGDGTFREDQTLVGAPALIDANSDGMIDIATVTDRGTLIIHYNMMAGLQAYKAAPGAASLSGSSGDDTMSDTDGGTVFFGGLGNDTIKGGSNLDTAVFSGLRAAYNITQTTPGSFSVIGPDGVDTLSGIEYAKFDDATLRLLPGTGVTVDFATAPSSYMKPIRDFDGNNFTGQGTQRIDPVTGALVGGGAWDGVSGWSLAGTADVSGGGLQSHILFNNQVGRWAEVTTQTDGKVYFNNHGWAGDTRVVGIYIDPLVQSGAVQAGGDHDSQRRFQNDLFIGNLKSVLHAADYDKDGGQEVYFSLTDGTAYLHAYMHADGNIRYANYQSKQQVQDYLAANSYGGSVTWLAAAPPEKLGATWTDTAPLMAAADPLAPHDLIAPQSGMLAGVSG